MDDVVHAKIAHMVVSLPLLGSNFSQHEIFLQLVNDVGQYLWYVGFRLS